MKLFKGSTYIERLAHDGRGVGTIEGKTAFVFGALPGETAHVEARSFRKRYYDATATAIENPSTARVVPECPAFGQCGGCRLQHLTLFEQRQHKQTVVADLFKHVGQMALESSQWMPPLFGEPFGYRHKARLGLRLVPKKGGLLLGFRMRQSNKLLCLEDCKVLPPALAQILAPIRLCLDSLEAREFLSQIEVAATDTQIALVLRHLKPLSINDQETLIAFAKSTGICWYLQSGGPETVVPLWPSIPEVLWYELPAFGLRFKFQPLDFTQINPALNQKMVEQALAWLKPEAHQTALDLFCGIGNFSLALAKKYHSVLGVEGSLALVERARENARLNQLSNVTFQAADLTKLGCLTEKCDALVLDPPRSGALEILPEVVALGPKRILYVSCNPSTLARDAQVLVHQYGYCLEKIGIVDMFVHTEHIETMCLFTKP